MIVHVLLEENDNGNCNTAFCQGVYYTFEDAKKAKYAMIRGCLLYTSPSPRDS